MNKIELVVVLAITVVVVIVWVSSDIFFAPQPNTQNTNVQSLLDPVTTKFDQDTLNKINALPAAQATSAPNTAPTPLPKQSSPTPSPKSSATTKASATASATPRF